MKKFITVILALLMAASLVACNETTVDETTGSDVETSPETEPEETLPAEENLPVEENGVTITSLDGKLTAAIYQGEDGGIYYTLTAEDGTVVLNESKMGVSVNGTALFEGASFTETTTRHFTATYPYLGNFSEMVDDCVAATVGLEKDGYAFSIEVKLYDNGLAYRYNLPATGETRTVSGEQSSFCVNNAEAVWTGKGSGCYESAILSYAPDSFTEGEMLCGPLMIELKDDSGYVSLLEGYVDESYPGAYFLAGAEQSITVAKVTSETAEDVYTGWRIVNYSKDLGDIAVNNIVYHTALGMNEDTSAITIDEWITPGKSVWTWINGSVDYENQKEYTLMASKLGFEYSIIDEGYTTWENYEEKLLDLGLTGEEMNVKQILWCAFPGGRLGLQIDSEEDAVTVAEQLDQWHISGIKLDFWPDETNPITNQVVRKTLEETAKYEIICNFHGIHKPTSFSVHYPNELTREGILGLECLPRGGFVEHAKYITSQYYTRFLAGHADFTPDVLTSMQIGSTIIMDSPLFVISTPPDQILASEALEMIKAIPTVWDRTVFLDGKIGQYVSVAKEQDGVWYVGGVASATLGKVTVDFSKILGEGEYLLTCWKDSYPQGFGIADTMEKIEQVVTKDTVLELNRLYAGCGYAMQITKLALSQYGGEITAPVTVTTASADSVVKYTTDGSDPMTSATATEYTEAITLTESCRLRVAIVSGDGEGSALSYQFNKIDTEA